jgi:hypothetical protein
MVGHQSRRKIPSRFTAKRSDLRPLYRAIRRINNEESRNLVRGVVSREVGPNITASSMNILRKESNIDDLSLIVEVLLGKKGVFPFSNLGVTYREILRFHNLSEIPANQEIAFLAGHLNGWPDEVLRILGAIQTLSQLPTVDARDGLGALLRFAQEWGASNYLAKKIAYVVVRNGGEDNVTDILSEISIIVNQTRYSVPYFTALESIDDQFPYFEGMFNRVKILSKYITDDYRKLLPLHNIVPCPTDIEDLGAFLRKSHSMSLVDEVIAVAQLFSLRARWPSLADELSKRLSISIRTAFKSHESFEFDPRTLYGDANLESADYCYYRRSIAFLEFRAPCLYRGYVDGVVAHRIMPLANNNRTDISDYHIPTSRDLTKTLNGFRAPEDYKDVQRAGKFLRTVHFLLHLEATRTNLSVDHHQLRKIFENTLSLDVLMSEAEIENLYATADDASRPLITVLALALFKARHNDDDVDFKFRLSLSDTIIETFDSSIVKFFEWLLKSTPEVANFLLSTLDRPTLQKMYWIVKSPDEADLIRQEILRIVGRQRGEIQYYLEADSIEAQRQVAKLQRYFDDSRIYVDSYAMKKWLIENPNSYAQQYLRLIEKSVDRIAISTVRTGSVTNAVTELIISPASDYVLLEVAKGAYTQFCVNTTFGIESYLGRRIRHNTLTGMMRGGVEEIIDKNTYYHLKYDDRFEAVYRVWLEEYRAGIETLRRDLLQFKGPNKPKGLFSAEISGDDDQVLGNVTSLRNLLNAAKSTDLFNDFLVRFCWQTIDPQLKAASRFITVDLCNAALSTIKRLFEDFDNPAQKQFLSELTNAVHERYTRLGSWFRLPESGFFSATTRQLGDLISVEATNGELIESPPLTWTGDHVDTVLDGLSVHRMYDCLSVVLRNAFSYGVPRSPIDVSVTGLTLAAQGIARLAISVTSAIKPEELEVHAKRLKEGFEIDETGAAMTVEGYSGIRKLRFITATSEGRSTATWSISEHTCTISFVLVVELATEGERQQ